MLLSLYASFRLSGEKHYFIKICVLILLLSFFSTIADPYFLGALPGFLFWFFHLLSFPFYSWFAERRVPLAPPYTYSQRILTHDIRFLSKEILWLIPQGPVTASGDAGYVNIASFRVILFSMEIGSVPPDLPHVFTALFLFLVLVNAVGALLGYQLSKVKRIKELEFVESDFLIATLIGVFILGAGILLASIEPITGPTSPYYYDYDPYENRGQGIAFVIFGAIWLAINILSFAWIREPKKHWYKKYLDTKQDEKAHRNS